MAKMKGYGNARYDESRGMKDYMSGYDKGKMASMPKGMGGKVMGHEKAPKSIDVPCGQGYKAVKEYNQGYSRGYPAKAYDYKY